MKKTIIVIAAIAITLLAAFGVLFAIQNNNQNENLESIDQSLKQVDNGGIDKLLEGQGEISARPDTDGFCQTISWKDDATAWAEMPISKDGLRELARESSFGELVRLPEQQQIEKIIGCLTVEQLYSDATTQSIVWFMYKGNDGKNHRSKLLIQGPVDCKKKEDLRALINSQTTCCTQEISNCSILFGGKLCETPPCEKVVSIPCEPQEIHKDKKCKPCGNGSANHGSSARQGDGAVDPVLANGGSHEIKEIDF